MIVIKPIVITDSNLTSSTIPEPDISAGEVEWEFRASGSTTRVTLDATGQMVTGAFIGGGYIGGESEHYLLSTRTESGQLATTIFRYNDNYEYQGQIIVDFQGLDAGGYVAVDISNQTSSSGVPNPLNSNYAILIKTSSAYKVIVIGDLGATERIDRSVNGTVMSICTAWLDSQEQYCIIRIQISGDTWLDRFNASTGALLGSNLLTEVSDPRGIINQGGFFYIINRSGTIHKYAEATRAYIGVAVVASTFNDQISSIYTDGTDFLTCNKISIGGAVAGTAPLWDSLWVPVEITLPADPPYLLGDKVILKDKHKSYQVTTDETRDNPADGVNLVPPTWVEVGSTSRFAAFDEQISSQSAALQSIIVEVTPNRLVGGIAVFNIEGATSINITMTDPVDGVVYNKDVSMVNNININNWFNYLWDGFDVRTEFVFIDLPPFLAATTKVTFTGTGEVKVGALVLGDTVNLGTTNIGTNVQQLDFNLYQEDQFGNLEIIKRPSAKLVNFKNTVQKERLPYVFAQLEELRGVNAVWVGDETDENDFTLVYGAHRDNTLNIDSFTACTVPLQIRGLT